MYDSASPCHGWKFSVNARHVVTSSSSEGIRERIRKALENVEISISPYDTAWVALVPSPNSPWAPSFPECLKWVLDNQLRDGSWGPPDRHPLLVKDSLSSTLACVLALRRWGIGEMQMANGIEYLKSNFSSLYDEKQYTTIGFDILFSGMIEYAVHMDLNLPLRSADIIDMLHKRYSELKRIRRGDLEGGNLYLSYLSEGLGNLQDWEMVMKHQRKNGSLFNSPSATAAALTHVQNADCHNYLRTVLDKFGNAVPAVYPMEINARLSIITAMERLGIDRHFEKEIHTVLDQTYRGWMQGEEEIFLDASTCAMAFYALRGNGYEVSSESLSRFAEGDGSLEGQLKDVGAILELYRASQLIIYPDESVLEKQNSWTGNFLRQELCNSSIHADKVKEVDDAIQFPYHANLDRLAHRRSMEHYKQDNIRILKTSYRLNICDEHLLALAVEDFNTSQSIYSKELEHIGRCIFYDIFKLIASIFSPQQSDARASWAKNSVLATITDDFFDVGGTREELWDVNVSIDACSEQVEIIFSALHSTISEIAENIITSQGRHVTKHLIQIWLDFLKSMFQEAEWTRNKSVPTLNEYLETAHVSFGMGPIILPAVYLVGPKFSDEVVNSHEYYKLYQQTSLCGRLLNDIQSYKREYKEGKLNAVTLQLISDGRSGVTEDDVIKKLKSDIDHHTREDDGFTTEKMMKTVKDLFYEPVKLD
ncbi:hypothetical protein ACFE04_024041 [Oxalis oulophora]